MRTIRDQVAIVGMGATKTGELWDKGVDDLIIEAASEALADAGLETKDVQAGLIGTNYDVNGHIPPARALKTGQMPWTEVLNGCATGGDVFRTGAAFVASGLYDIVIACGAEKLKDDGGTGVPAHVLVRGTQVGAGGSTAAGAAPFAVRYAHRYGYSDEELKHALGHIAIKNHQNGTRNPKAAFQKAITWEQYIDAPLIAWPLGLYDCCANVDGAAAAIITTPEIARKLKDNYALVRAIGASTDDGFQSLSTRFDHASLPGNTAAAQVAYQMSGIKNPVQELSGVQSHDAFTIVELLCYEALGLCPAGQAPRFVEAGFFDAEGELPVNTDGGLKCFGHPMGATGLKMLYEPYLQLQGRAGPRQIKNPKLALAQTQSGANAASSIVTILAPRD